MQALVIVIGMLYSHMVVSSCRSEVIKLRRNINGPYTRDGQMDNTCQNPEHAFTECTVHMVHMISFMLLGPSY